MPINLLYEKRCKVVHSQQEMDAIDIPDEFICPLTLEIFSDPLISKHGHNFERRAILEWLAEGSSECPLTRKPLSPSMLIPNVQMRLKVKKWQEENKMEASTNGLEARDKTEDFKLVFSTTDPDGHRLNSRLLLVIG
ncbi:U-box domain containing protein [Nitzschia inconspicua]|uniref:U-box domain containing protein n=1 Tax=Nitzschia inconspicua TaxID=303405 RepID=A0A9K3PVM3_9STRA|nr:U-box domain containing protein [Nitzschia inconspicua]